MWVLWSRVGSSKIPSSSTTGFVQWKNALVLLQYIRNPPLSPAHTHHTHEDVFCLEIPVISPKTRQIDPRVMCEYFLTVEWASLSDLTQFTSSEDPLALI